MDKCRAQGSYLWAGLCVEPPSTSFIFGVLQVRFWLAFFSSSTFQ